ncbi:MAG: DUF1540 domain-containing protein [Niameybacter sp.]|uniref:DUF1540 domain-containing protein n=1 Tax=Niameybacter sp. TaxID=2033640 RepID=UPI002FC89DBD
MPKLRCTVDNCSYNKEEYCTLNYILVDGDGQVATNVEDTCCTNFDASEYTLSNQEHMAQAVVDIKCTADHCIFNEDNVCEAEEVGMAGASTCTCSQDTQCGTFRCGRS